MNGLNLQNQNKILYISLVITNFFYVLIAYVLISEGQAEQNLGFTLLLAGASMSILLMVITTINAIKSEADRVKTITKLAIFHTPCLTGMLFFMLFGFGVL